MAYRVTKTVKGRRYLYEQRAYREGKRVRTESRYIGPVDGPPARRRLGQKIADFIKANMTPRDFVDAEQMLKDYDARAARDEQARHAKLDDLYAKYGLRVSDDRPELRAAAVHGATAPAMDQNVEQPSELDTNESPSSEEGQGSGESAPDAAQNS